MMLEDAKNIHGTDKQLKEFAYLVGGIFIALGLFFAWKGGHLYPWFIGAGSILLIVRVLYFKGLQPLYKGWMTLAVYLGFVVSRVLLSIIYFLLISPIALFSRMIGKSFLNMGYKTDEETYWVIREDKEIDAEQYEKQY